MQQFLSTTERFTLKEVHLVKRDKHFADRIKTILLLDDGLTFDEISRVLFLDDQTCRRYFKTYQEHGLDGLLQDNYQGGKSKLSLEQENSLKMHLKETPYYSAKEVVAPRRDCFAVKLIYFTSPVLPPPTPPKNRRGDPYHLPRWKYFRKPEFI